MQKISFNNDWECYPESDDKQVLQVTLPHDAMQLDLKSKRSMGGANIGWYDARDYRYTKNFFIPSEYETQNVSLLFEGVYHRATVYVNGIKAAYHSYGYTEFAVKLDALLRYGEINHIEVHVKNTDQPNSRWYSGTGIYRPVWLYVLPVNHILSDGIKIKTLSAEAHKIEIEVHTSHPGEVTAEIYEYDEDDSETRGSIAKEPGGELLGSESKKTDGLCKIEMTLTECTLWSPDTPALYTCLVTYKCGESIERRQETFGIRTVSLDQEKGFCLNETRIILRGACIHHDNGLLGARAYDFAEERKVRLLKENGYNAIRMAHNPCSRAILRACDRLGMLVVDEYVDVWYIHKTKYDYASEVEKNYHTDLARIVNKDYNHPSVIMYSTGNEVSESAQKRGIELCENMTDRLHELDNSRPVTCGINIFFNFLSSMGFGVYSDKKAEKEAANTEKKKAVGSEFFNKLAGKLGADFMKFGATLYPCDVKTRDAFTAMDIAGYNYGIKRYKHDLKKYPDRWILGTETFCSDAYRFYEMAKKNKRLIGDFVWAGMDYLGEVAVGAWEYAAYAKNFTGDLGWVSAGSGRIDLTGKPLFEMEYTKVAFEQKKIAIGVIPVPYADKAHSPSAWKMTNAIESWSFSGSEGMQTKVVVAARANRVELCQNGALLESKPVKKDGRVEFDVVYQDGNIEAVSYDASDREIARCSLKSAGKETRLTLLPEQEKTSYDGDLSYIRLCYTDGEGTIKPMVNGEISLNVEGGTLLGFGSGCPYYEKSYLSETADTYYGEALAIVRPDRTGMLKVTAESKYGNGTAEVIVL